MRLLASFMTLALPLALTAVAPAFAHEDGTSHEDGNVFHDRSYGRHVDHEYGPNGRHVDRVYRYPDRDPYGYGGYDYDGRFSHTHRRYYDPDYGYNGRRYSRYDDDDDD